MPKPPPGHDRFLDVDLPEWFVLEVKEFGHWSDFGLFSSKVFVRLDDGTYFCSAGGSLIYIRCIGYRRDGIEHVDGGGRKWLYRVRPYRAPQQS